MELEQVALKLQETTDRSLRNEGRIKKLEGEHSTLQSLATSVAVMAEQMKTMNANVNSLTNKVDVLEAKPGKRWESVTAHIILAVVSALIGVALARFGM